MDASRWFAVRPNDASSDAEAPPCGFDLLPMANAASAWKDIFRPTIRSCLYLR
jgi:hypothetical protein